MCGYIVTSESIDLVRSYLEAIRYRGPDATVSKVIQNIAFGFNRLAFQGVSEAGMQPMTFGERWTLVYNGEIYNAKDLEKTLLQSGRSFKNSSGADTEVLLAFLVFCIEEEKFHLLSLIDGIYSFVFHDARHNEIYFSNDKFGVKPQFYLLDDGKFIICSDLSFYKNYELGSPSVYKKYLDRPQSLMPIDLYSSFQESLPGCVYKLDLKTSQCTIVYNYKFQFTSRWKFFGNLINIQSKIEESIRLNCVGDYPICYLLSGGIDSSLIALTADRLAGNNNTGGFKVDTFSVDFKGDPLSESLFRRKVLLSANSLRGTEVVIDADLYLKALEEYINDSRRLPLIPNEVALYVLFKTVSESGYRVAISGEGADEIFDGYHYVRDAAITNLMRSLSCIPVIGDFLKRVIINKSFRFKSYLDHPSSLLDHFTDDVSYIGGINQKYRLHTIKEILIKKYLRGLLYRADNASMMSSVELRVPFLSKSIVDTFNIRPISFFSIFLAPKFLLKILLFFKFGYKFAFSKKRGFAIPWANWYSGSSVFRQLWDHAKADPFIQSLAKIPDGIEQGSGFNEFFERTGFRLLCIFIHQSNRSTL